MTEQQTQELEWYYELLDEFMKLAPKNRTKRGRVAFLNACGELYDTAAKAHLSDTDKAYGFLSLLFLAKMPNDKHTTMCYLLANLYEGKDTYHIDDESYHTIAKYVQDKGL